MGKTLRRYTPLKRSTKPIPKRSKKPHKQEIYRKDREIQLAVSGEGICFNCREWKMLGGDHAIKRRFFEFRHDLTNIRRCCWPCNVALETLSCEKLIKKYPDSPLVPEWRERMLRKKVHGKETTD